MTTISLFSSKVFLSLSLYSSTISLLMRLISRVLIRPIIPVNKQEIYKAFGMRFPRQKKYKQSKKDKIMKITISGRAGSGKSTVAKLIAKQLNLKHYSAGDLMRQMAFEKKMSLLELSKEAEINPDIDKEIDKKTEKLGRIEDNFIMDSRLAFHFIPDSIKIFLTVDRKEAARRIFNDLRPQEKENLTLDETEKNIIKRENYEKERYKKYYGLNPYDNLVPYDIIVDTTGILPKKAADKIIEFIKKRTA